ncbi:NAD(P)-dependent oxidoreductase [Fictibacillus phosphorivorans]|uniref:NAD(P)-dependent oxidoreductase n=1 Tax=Fictibacillus phosphorivorans TaxID=1221500 RepID=UPI001293CAB0|nr:SDR family oxidoreductase [Fictibacillus phosphorivorans]MQR94085.1 SDR family oxidoreductase [Fictibacillus phosphorivorans]
MKLCVLGATGRVGQYFTKMALQNDISVSALLRNPEKFTNSILSQLSFTKGDVLSKESIAEAMKGCDVVFSALSTDGASVLSEGMPIVIEAMKKEKISRIITISTAGILQSRTEPHLLRYQSSESKRKLTRAAEEHHKAFTQLQESGLDWTIVCPTYLPDGEPTGTYRTEKDVLPIDGSKITTGDTAHFAFSLLSKNDFSQSRVGIAY